MSIIETSPGQTSEVVTPATKNQARRPLTLRGAVRVLSWLPLLWLIWAVFIVPATVDPVQYGERFSGQAAIVFLILSLACSPLVFYLNFRAASTVRKPLGLFAFFYASVHFLLYAGLDFRFDFQLLNEEVLSKLYLITGLLALVILIALAATSYKPLKRAMGRAWKRLHRLVYAAGALSVLHYSWAKKGDLLSLSGEQVFPALAGLGVLLLLALRLPFVKQAFLRVKARLATPPEGGAL